MTTTVNTQSTKAEEIAHLQAIAKTAGPGSYLSSLFNPKLIEWAVIQIKDDGCPDIWEWYQSDLKKAAAADQKARQLDHDAQDIIARHANTIREQAASLARTSAFLATAENDRASLSSKLVVLQAQTAEAEDIARATIEAQAAEITRLKARLFDMIEAR
jgi:hypothetical protein